MSASGKAKEIFQIVIDARKKAEVESAIGSWCESHPGSCKGDAFESAIPEILRALAAPANPGIAGDVERISDGIRLIQMGVTGMSTAFSSLRSVVEEEYTERLDSQAKCIAELRERIDRYENGWTEEGAGEDPPNQHPSYEKLSVEARRLRSQVEELRDELVSAQAGKREAERSLNERLDIICRAFGLDVEDTYGKGIAETMRRSDEPAKAAHGQQMTNRGQSQFDFSGTG